ncbi:MAG: phage terminase large subunit [Parcubacteria group bacterium]|jgi:predicted phage terminase large subunit-like protein
MEKNSPVSSEIMEKMFKDRRLRVEVTRRSHFWSFNVYFSHYVKYETAPFQKEMFRLTEQEDIKNLFICAFRGSSKSTIMTMSYPIWSILGIQQKKFVLILCQTKTQAKQHMVNLKRELESNQLLKNDLGPFEEESDEWGSSSLVFSNLNARITAASSEQSIRGLRHNQYRPDLIIGDDVEDLASTKTREGRDKTYQWFTGDVIPAGDKNTRIVMIGNLLHEDSMLMKLKRDLDEGKIKGAFRFYPLLDKNNKILWPGKYPSMADIEEERKKIGNEISWQREYLLKIIPNEDQVIHRSWIRYYDELPQEENRKTFITVDLAISEKSSADFTAVVTMVVYRRKNDFRAFILPNPINRRMGFPKTLEIIKRHYEATNINFRETLIVVEEVAYQSAVPQQLQNDCYPAEGFRVSGDKRSRLAMVANLIKNGNILFPLHGAEALISQIVNFGSERHDDLVDAFTLAAHKLIAEGRPLHASDFIS